MLVEGRLHIDGVPQHNHVDDDAECVELVFLAFTVTLPQFATFAVEDGAGQGMATFSPVQLDQRGATFGLIVEVRQRVDCLVDPSELRERLRQARWPIPHLQRAHDTGGRYAPEFQRADRPQHIVPLWGDSVEVDGLACHAAWPPTSPSCTMPAAPLQAPRWRSPRRASGRSWPGKPYPPASGRPGYSPGTGGPPEIGAADRRGRSGSRTLPPCSPPATGRGVESDQVALERGRVDAVIAGLLFMAGMRRSEVSALRWDDVVDSTDGDGILVTVRRSKTSQEGEVNDVRYVKDGVARALRTLRAATTPGPGDRVVPLSPQMVGLRFTVAARAAGVESRVTAHSGRVGLASELTSRGASTTDVMLAGNWRTSRMVAHYSAGATAERGAVARYL